VDYQEWQAPGQWADWQETEQDSFEDYYHELEAWEEQDHHSEEAPLDSLGE